MSVHTRRPGREHLSHCGNQETFLSEGMRYQAVLSKQTNNLKVYIMKT